MDFSGKCCLVTGAARGIGRAIAEAILDKGGRVLLADILWKVATSIFVQHKLSLKHVFSYIP